MEKRIERIISFDVMRIVAAFAVVFQHIGGQNWPSSFPSAEWELRNMWVSLAQWSVPMFIMISGALFLNPEKPLVIKKLYGKNLLRIVYTFLFWSAVYVICIEGFENGPGRQYKHYQVARNRLPTVGLRGRQTIRGGR